MPNILVNTADAAYQNKVTTFIAMRDYMRPLLKHYISLSEEDQLAWKSQDQLLRIFVNLSDKFQAGKDDDGSGD